MTEIDVAPLAGDELLGRAVRSRGLRLGHVTDLLVDLAGARVAGFEVVCGDGGERFLPIAAAELSSRAVEVSSALTLLDRQGAAFYLDRATPLSALRSVPLATDRGAPVRLVDVRVCPDGAVESLLVSENGGPARQVRPGAVRALAQPPAA